MKHYYISFELGDGIPDYDFVLRAKNIDIAMLKARKILRQDYPMEWRIQKGDFGCSEITADELLQRMCLNYLMTQKEEREILQIAEDNKKRKDKGWSKEVERTELEYPVDLVVISAESRVVQSKCVWQDIKDIGRLKRLIEREQRGYGSDSIVVAVNARTRGLGDILQEQDIIKL